MIKGHFNDAFVQRKEKEKKKNPVINNNEWKLLLLDTKHTIYYITYSHTHYSIEQVSSKDNSYIYSQRLQSTSIMTEGNNLPKQGIEGQILVKTCMSLHHLSVLVNVIRTNICYAEKTSYFSPPDLFILYPSYINSWQKEQWHRKPSSKEKHN